MGSTISQEVYDSLEEDQSHTPKSGLKTLPRELDPRSPTQGVDRTPIHFVATPMKLDDPRSPSVGIERTPIYPLDKASEHDVNLISMKEGDQPNRESIPFDLMDKDEDMSSSESSCSTSGPAGSILDRPNPPLIQTKSSTEVEQCVLHAEVTLDSGTLVAAKRPQKARPLHSLVPGNPSFSPRSPLTTRNVASGDLRSMVQIKEAQKAMNMKCLNSTAGDLQLRKASSLFDKENVYADNVKKNA